MTKDALREMIREKRKLLAKDWLEICGGHAQQRLLDMDAFVDSDVVACYLAIGYEVPTLKVLEACWAAGKTVCVPVYNKVTEQYELADIKSDTEMKAGFNGISEPGCPVLVGFDKVDLVVVPGLAFDTHGRRIGYGTGFYDQILSAMTAVRVGLAFDFQVFDMVPSEAHDESMNVVITETKTIMVD